MKQDLFPDDPNKITSLLKSIREAHFASGLGCVHCGSTSVKRNGKYRSRQRYLCNDCGKSFNDMTNTAFYWRHKILNALENQGFNQLQGIVERDETFFRESMKGNEIRIETRRSVERKTKNGGFPT